MSQDFVFLLVGVSGLVWSGHTVPVSDTGDVQRGGRAGRGFRLWWQALSKPPPRPLPAAALADLPAAEQFRTNILATASQFMLAPGFILVETQSLALETGAGLEGGGCSTMAGRRGVFFRGYPTVFCGQGRIVEGGRAVHRCSSKVRCLAFAIW